MGWATLAAADIQAMGAIQSSQASAAAAGYNAKIANQNAQIATQNAQLAGAAGEQQAGQAGLQTRSETAAVKTQEAGDNVDVNTGSAKAQQQSYQEMGMLNQKNVMTNAALKAYGFETQSQSYTEQAALDRSAQSADKTGGILKAVGAVASGASNAFEFSGGGNTEGVTGGGTNVGSSYLGAAEEPSTWNTYAMSGGFGGSNSGGYAYNINGQ